MTHELWANLNERILDYLQSVTLADLVAQQQQKAAVVVLQDHRPAAPPRLSDAEAVV